MKNIASHYNKDPLLSLLTPRTIEVLQLIADGGKNGDIAERLFVAVPTVNWHRCKIKAGLEARTMSQATAIALRKGLIK